MKQIKWKSLVATCIICLLPIALGVALWDELPERVAIHFNMYNQPDNYASRGFAVFGLPILMAVLQAVCCLLNDMNIRRYRNPKSLEAMAKWIIPFMTIVLQIVTLGFALGWDIDIRKTAFVLLGIILSVTGMCMTKLDYIKNYDIDREKAKKINKFSGVATVVMGLGMLGTIFMPPVAAVIWLFMLIPYLLVCVVYGIIVSKR